MEFGSIEREIYVAASPDVVFAVISSPEHLREWWPDDADIAAVPGAVGSLTWNGDGQGSPTVVPMTVVDAEPPRLFSFRWAYAPGAEPGPTNSFLVRFDLEPSGEGTQVRMVETGFREQGWEASVLEAHYLDHVQGWDHFVPRLGEYVARLVSAS